MPVLGIAGLPQADTVTVSSLSGTRPAMNSFIPDYELAEAMSKVEQEAFERKRLKQQWMTIAVACVLLAALIVYASVK